MHSAMTIFKCPDQFISDSPDVENEEGLRRYITAASPCSMTTNSEEGGLYQRSELVSHLQVIRHIQEILHMVIVVSHGSSTLGAFGGVDFSQVAMAQSVTFDHKNKEEEQTKSLNPGNDSRNDVK
jgi:hypothetical protein